MPREFRSEFGPMVGLRTPDRDRKSAADLLNEINGKADGIMIVNLDHTVSIGIVNGRESI